MSEIPNCFYRISIKALVLDDEKRFLLVKENNGFWELPGGGLDFNETPQRCLAREIKEEMGLAIVSTKQQPVYFLTVLPSHERYWIGNVLYETRLKDFNFQPSDECVELRFFTKEEAGKENLHPNVKEFIKMYQPGNHQVEKDSWK